MATTFEEDYTKLEDAKPLLEQDFVFRKETAEEKAKRVQLKTRRILLALSTSFVSVLLLISSCIVDRYTVIGLDFPPSKNNLDSAIVLRWNQLDRQYSDDRKNISIQYVRLIELLKKKAIDEELLEFFKERDLKKLRDGGELIFAFSVFSVLSLLVVLCVLFSIVTKCITDDVIPKFRVIFLFSFSSIFFIMLGYFVWILEARNFDATLKKHTHVLENNIFVNVRLGTSLILLFVSTIFQFFSTIIIGYLMRQK